MLLISKQALSDSEKFLISLVSARAVEPVFAEPQLVIEDVVDIPQILREKFVNEGEASGSAGRNEAPSPRLSPARSALSKKNE